MSTEAAVLLACQYQSADSRVYWANRAQRSSSLTSPCQRFHHSWHRWPSDYSTEQPPQPWRPSASGWNLFYLGQLLRRKASMSQSRIWMTSPKNVYPHANGKSGEFYGDLKRIKVTEAPYSSSIILRSPEIQNSFDKKLLASLTGMQLLQRSSLASLRV